MNNLPEKSLTDLQRESRRAVLALLEDILPIDRILELDSKAEFPEEAYMALAKGGWFGLSVPEEFGGTPGSMMDIALFIETLSYHWNGICSPYLTNFIISGSHICRRGSEAVKADILPKLLEGQVRLAFALTEPSAGSDAASITTRAVRCESGWAVTGHKVFSTGAHLADYVVTVVRTDKDKKYDGISIMLVPTKSKNVTIRPLEGLGRRTQATNEIFYDNVFVPNEYVLGEINSGWYDLMDCLALERLGISMSHVGNSQAVTDYAIVFAKGREQFGRSISKFQVVKHKLVDMQIKTDMARLAGLQVAQLMDQGMKLDREPSVAKILCTDANVAVVDEGMQIMGGSSYMMEYPMQMHYRDCRIGPIGAGTNEIQREIIARYLDI